MSSRRSSTKRSPESRASPDARKEEPLGLVALPAADRARLEHLCRYLLRPAVAQNRLRLLDNGRIALTLKTAWADGTRHLVFESFTPIEKPAALRPRPRINLVLCTGCSRRMPAREPA